MSVTAVILGIFNILFINVLTVMMRVTYTHTCVQKKKTLFALQKSIDSMYMYVVHNQINHVTCTYFNDHIHVPTDCLKAMNIHTNPKHRKDQNLYPTLNNKSLETLARTYMTLLLARFRLVLEG